MEIVLSEADLKDASEVAELCALLWPDFSAQEHRIDLESLLQTRMYGVMPATIFVAKDGNDVTQGFIQVGVRSHADGCDIAQPVGYIEGWFVRESSRRQGMGTALMREAERWAREQSCKEMASDAWIDHGESLHAHRAAGYIEVDRCIHFRKTL